MLFLYIGATIVIALLTGFVLLSVVVVSRRVTQDIRMRASELLSSYDGLLEKKSSELERLNESIAEKKREEENYRQLFAAAESSREAGDETASDTEQIVMNTAERMSTARYQDSRTAEIYQKIRGNFDFSPIDVIRQLSGGETAEGPATGLLRQLDYKTICSLSMLSSEKQKEIMYEVLDGSGRTLLDEFISEPGPFRAIGFYDFLRSRAQIEPKRITLRIAPTAQQRYYPSNVDVIVDDSICEGFQIIVNNKLYDFSVRKREIS